MKKIFVLAIGLALAGCDSPERTADTLEKQISAYRAAPGAAQQQAVENSFAKLDAQIAGLREKGNADAARQLTTREATLRAEYSAAKVANTIQDAKAAIQGIGEVLKETGKNIQDAFRTPPPSTDE